MAKRKEPRQVTRRNPDGTSSTFEQEFTVGSDKEPGADERSATASAASGWPPPDMSSALAPDVQSTEWSEKARGNLASLLEQNSRLADARPEMMDMRGKLSGNLATWEEGQRAAMDAEVDNAFSNGPLNRVDRDASQEGLLGQVGPSVPDQPVPFVYMVDEFSDLEGNDMFFKRRRQIVANEVAVDSWGEVRMTSDLYEAGGARLKFPEGEKPGVEIMPAMVTGIQAHHFNRAVSDVLTAQTETSFFGSDDEPQIFAFQEDLPDQVVLAAIRLRPYAADRMSVEDKPVQVVEKMGDIDRIPAAERANTVFVKHSEDGTAGVLAFYGPDGELHRDEEKPAYVYSSGFEEHWVNGESVSNGAQPSATGPYGLRGFNPETGDYSDTLISAAVYEPPDPRRGSSDWPS